MQEFHAGDCGGHLYWKSTVDKILRAGYYWPTFFSDVKKFTTACHKCQVFEGKRQLLPLPLMPIATERPFQQWGLDFIGEINPSSSGQHRWILTATDYFTKWIEAIPCRQANDSTIIQFLETNILARFGCPHKIITDNAAAFRSKKMVSFCHKFHINLGHSTAYYPQGNGLAESSNKSLQTRDQVYNRVQILQEKLKEAFEKRSKAEDFNMGDKVIKWDARRENKGKHGKFDSIWRGPFIIPAVQGNNTYFLKNLDETDLDEGPVNGRMLKHYFDYLP
eukprot:PITA_16611